MRPACQLRALLLGALIGGAALAQTTPAQAPVAQSAPSPAPVAQSAPAQAVSPAPPSDDFELLPPEKAPDPAEVARGRELSRELSQRRSMLQLHQLGGFATVGAMVATAVVGQLNYNDKYGGGGYSGRYIVTHRWLGIGTTALFAATGLLAVLAPSPLPKESRLDTVTLHKVAMVVAAAGIVAQIILGPITASKEGQPSQRDFALAHQVIGYTTLAATATGFAVLVF